MTLNLLTACSNDTNNGVETNAKPAVESNQYFRLPDTVRPEHYRLDLTIIPDTDHFSGHTAIDIEIIQPVSTIWLHGKDLDIASAVVTTNGGRTLPATYSEVTTDGMARLDFAEELQPQHATINFDYTAPFKATLNGLYKVKVGEDSYGFTQFESIYARRAFPSFDEPRFKTPFDISVTTRSAYSAFSNTLSTDEIKLDNDLKKISYATTKPLPTYLVAFAVGPLDVVEWTPIPPSTLRDQPIPLRGLAARGQGKRMAWALENTAELLEWLEEYFAIAYPYDKLDIVAVPDFASGAMENAGLITYREPLLLFGDRPSINMQRRYAMTHAHELSHQWFGNLVTMPWWDDIWLNEAFASWIQAKAAHDWSKEYKFDRNTQARAINAMSADSLITARQIRQPVNNSGDIVTAFDGITYLKGAGVLQMIERYLGENNFREGIRNYMREHAFGSATVYDLIAALTKATQKDTSGNKDVKGVFESFLFQPGVPYVDVAMHCDTDKVTVALAQERYLPLGSAGDRNKTWKIPACLAWGTGTERSEECVLLTEKKQTVSLSTSGECPAWLMPNAGGAGHFRWNLDADGMQALLEVFNTALDAQERISLVDSLIAGVYNGSIPVGTLVEMLPDISAAKERTVVTSPLGIYRRILTQLLSDDLRETARNHADAILTPRLAALDGADGAESKVEATMLRRYLVDFLALDVRSVDLRNQLKEAAHQYIGYQADGALHLDALDPDVLTTALIVAVQDSDHSFTDALIEQLKASDNQRLRQAIITALAKAIDPDVIRKSRALVMSDAVRSNELQNWLSLILNHDSRDENLPWVQKNLDLILKSGSDRIARDAPRSFGKWFCSDEDAAQLKTMFESRVDDYIGSRRVYEQTLESIDLCTAFKKGQSDNAAEYFSGLMQKQ
ncbi:MAG: M1 family metallopeptidase [Gammaproteobacteria bacterium]|nr:M1 family metallopeptidase [Gammaproteobacteria bacterium]